MTFDRLDELTEQLLEQVITQNASTEEFYPWADTVRLFCALPTYKILRVTAVLTAMDDGTQPLGTMENGRVVPAEGLLRNSQIHTHPDENYIKDWIGLANLQLLYSGAHFGLDINRITYTIENNTHLHQRVCGDNQHTISQEYFEQRAAEPNSPYKDSVILVFRWGKGTNPTGQGCSDVTSNMMLMPGKYNKGPRYLDGQLVIGSNILTHEFGHFMGLMHTFRELALAIDGYATEGNPKRLPLTEANLPEMPGVNTPDDILRKRSLALKRIAESTVTAPAHLDIDTGGRTHEGVVIIPPEYGVKDTPADVGWGLPLVCGISACQGTYDVTFEKYEKNDLQEIADSSGNLRWEPKPGAVPTLTTPVTIDETLRTNIMSYWFCSNDTERFSKDQVTRMHYVLENIRAKLVGRVIEPQTIPCWVLRLPLIIRKFRIGESIKNRLLAIYLALLKILRPRFWEAATVLDELVRGHRRWDTVSLRQHLTMKAQAGTLLAPEDFNTCGVDLEPQPE